MRFNQFLNRLTVLHLAVNDSTVPFTVTSGYRPARTTNDLLPSDKNLKGTTSTVALLSKESNRNSITSNIPVETVTNNDLNETNNSSKTSDSILSSSESALGSDSIKTSSGSESPKNDNNKFYNLLMYLNPKVPCKYLSTLFSKLSKISIKTIKNIRSCPQRLPSLSLSLRCLQRNNNSKKLSHCQSPSIVVNQPWLKKTPSIFYPFAPPQGVMNFRSPEIERLWIDVDQEYSGVMDLKMRLIDNHNYSKVYKESSDLTAIGSIEDIAEYGPSWKAACDKAGREALECILKELENRSDGTIERDLKGLVYVRKIKGVVDNKVKSSELSQSDNLDIICDSATGNNEKKDILIIHNLITNKQYRYDPNSTTGIEALKIAAKLVQEDLVVMMPHNHEVDGNTFVLGLGIVCFPDRWNFQLKIGKTLNQIHAKVPHYNKPVQAAAQGLFKGLKQDNEEKLTPARIRFNYTFQPGKCLYMPDDEPHEQHSNHENSESHNDNDIHDISSESQSKSETKSEDSCPEAPLFLRVERQGLKHVCGTSGARLFTIRTYLSPIKDLPKDLYTPLMNAMTDKVKTSLGKHHQENYLGRVKRELGIK